MNKIIKASIILLILAAFSTEGVIAQTNVKSKKPKKPKDYGKSFFDKDAVHTIRINMHQCNFWDSLVYYKKVMDSIEIAQYMQATVNINGKIMHACGIRIKGESSFEFYPGKKKAFRLKFDKFVKGQDFEGLEDLNLTNNFKDPTMIREKIYLDLMHKHGLPAPRATFAKVYINDKYWGLYLVNENIDRVFLKTRFNDDRGNLFQGDPIANFVYLGNDQSRYYLRYTLKSNEEKNDWSDLVRLIKKINDTILSDEEYVKRLESSMDLDKLLKCWAINNLIGNIDAYNMFYPHNFFVYHDSLTLKWHWISLDGNYSFAAWNPIMNYPQLIRMSVMVPDSTPYNDKRPLLEHTIGKNKILQKRYLAIVKELFYSDFLPERMNSVIDSLALKIRVSVYADTHKMYSNTDFDTNLNSTIGDPLDPGNFIPGLKGYMIDRRKFIEQEIEELSRRLN
ncbi:MAG: hypothetical protein DWQ44_08785 [Bacteroidetes bacterium]|nr:MAG: hypothetical protein DWQ33_02190 [Bacteroidota bacterium]REK06935.1 MAG: hypothetical protein DWQ39_01905 [Bacteroidota bacterium]REK33718.1 MAG: hypothetical protein DWQ44_08785 [Bacteroidota bacterium]REK49389.1 MAG: hypothetical protein DWQ48_07495 [Bacteroidota bacterium]